MKNKWIALASVSGLALVGCHDENAQNNGDSTKETRFFGLIEELKQQRKNEIVNAYDIALLELFDELKERGLPTYLTDAHDIAYKFTSMKYTDKTERQFALRHAHNRRIEASYCRVDPEDVSGEENFPLKLRFELEKKGVLPPKPKTVKQSAPVVQNDAELTNKTATQKPNIPVNRGGYQHEG